MADQVIDVNPLTGGRREIIVKQFSWAAIFAGTLVALAVEVLFLTFGFFIGFRLTPGSASVWSIIWTFFGAFTSFFLGGWVAGRLGGNPANGRTHGIVTWGLATVTTFMFLALLSWGVMSQSMGIVRTAALAASNVAPTVTANANRVGVPSRVRAGEANRSMQEQANQAVNQAQAAWPYAAQALARTVSDTSLFIWISFMIAAAGALAGGAAGAPRSLTAGV